MLSEIFEIIKELLKKIWDFIKKIFVKILNFAINIIKFFRDKQRIKKLNENKKLMAIAIKEKLENGNFRVVNCLYDESIDDIVDYEDDAIGITAEKLDKKTEKAFGNKDMLILE